MNPEYYEKQNLISQKILELTQQQNQAQEQLAQLDFAPRLLELKQELTAALVAQQSNQRAYQEQLTALHSNYEAALKKLDRVRDLELITV